MNTVKIIIAPQEQLEQEINNFIIDSIESRHAALQKPPVWIVRSVTYLEKQCLAILQKQD